MAGDIKRRFELFEPLNVLFMVSVPDNSRIPPIDFRIAAAVFAMVIDHAARLQVGIDGDAAEILETAAFQILADAVG